MGVEITALRPINVEDLTRGDPKGGNQSFAEHVASVAGSAAGKKNENLRNVGPSVEYKLIDDAGQAHEFQNYMLPVELDGATVFRPVCATTRPSPSATCASRRMTTARSPNSCACAPRWPIRRRAEAARRFAERNSPSGADRQPLQTAAERALETFAGGGLQAVAAFLQANTPPADRSAPPTW